MRRLSFSILAAGGLALAGCANSEDASTEAEADTVEIPAFDALSDVESTPVADPNANTDLGPDAEAPVEEGAEGSEDGAAPAPGESPAVEPTATPEPVTTDETE
ncbi:hypothetical protein [Qipengyuania atrilutea]|uniref:Uncharacterized protein n=1 Tax=Qipengyuania atrilutea TaxID=2744473 RepID=A0A850H3F0_9SPHN|nr:hypothetical protein [Actirhodobacter atriluteus]NVD45186.1 hypothetical protein [Actirhodobacter atriluteus]